MVGFSIGLQALLAVSFFISLRLFKRSKSRGDKEGREKARLYMAISIAFFIDGLIVFLVPQSVLSTNKLFISLILVSLLVGVVTRHYRNQADE